MRKKLKEGIYFEPEDVPSFFPSGCAVLDCVLGGGWAEDRVINLVGDKSTGKTLLATEAAVNFLLKHDDGEVVYNETEAAFDMGYARAIGLPLDRFEFVESCETVEDLFEDLMAWSDTKVPLFYVCDSLDALSDHSEMGRDLGDSTYGTKAKQLSQMFRRANRTLANSRMTVMIVSQVRDNIGVTFGERHIRAGGRAMDFYASQILWLSQTKQLKRTVKKVERTVGIRIRAKCKKNKVGVPFRECQFPVTFYYGIDDLQASLDFLVEVGSITSTESKQAVKRAQALSDKKYRRMCRELGMVVSAMWHVVEDRFTTRRSKYG